MLKVLFETSHPWNTFKDPCNIKAHLNFFTDQGLNINVGTPDGGISQICHDRLKRLTETIAWVG